MAKCTCSATAHGHGNPSGREVSSASDNLCKECREKKAQEFAKTKSG
jgi:hypothetical protein